MNKIRIIVIDDSLTIRKKLCEILAASAEFDVVGEGDNGEDAIRLCHEYRPDVISMDMMMPVMTGVTATEYIMGHFPTPILIVSASTNRSELFHTYDALAAGAVDAFEKPRGNATDADWERRYLSTLRIVSKIKVITHPRARLNGLGSLAHRPIPTSGKQKPTDDIETGEASHRVLAIGASTGGPSAIVEVLRGLPPNLPVPIALVLHIDEPFGMAFAEWLDGQSTYRVAYARDGEYFYNCAGRVVVAPPGRHLTIEDHRIRLTSTPPRHSCRPSVDVLFETLAREYRHRTAACLLTGMGRDGASGLLEIRQAGGFTIAQDEATSVVYGMPREAALLNAAQQILPLQQIGPALGAMLHRQTGDVHERDRSHRR